jgi:hypothetical protein
MKQARRHRARGVRTHPASQEASFGSPEYEAIRQEIEPALDHHYAENQHQAEHFKNGVAGMNLIDLMEMVCAWVSAAAQRSDSTALSNLPKSADRFHIGSQLAQIMANTMALARRRGEPVKDRCDALRRLRPSTRSFWVPIR